MKIKAFLKRKENGQLFTDAKLKAEAKKVSGFGWEDIYQYCLENDYAGVVRSNNTVSLTTTESYHQSLFS